MLSFGNNTCHYYSSTIIGSREHWTSKNSTLIATCVGENSSRENFLLRAGFGCVVFNVLRDQVQVKVCFWEAIKIESRNHMRIYMYRVRDLWIKH